MNESTGAGDVEDLTPEGTEHWRLTSDSARIHRLCLSRAEASTNSLSAGVLAELDGVLDVVLTQRPRGLILWSDKSSGFAAGADINEFDQMTDPDETAQRIDGVHRLFDKLDRLPLPSVARVHGFCLGGGLELALACRHIVAAEENARLGFPEILLGIHPGFGGTVRSVRYCGATTALDLMLTGRTLDARRAVKAGLIDRAVPERHLDAAALQMILGSYKRRRPPLLMRMASTAPARPLIAAMTRRQVEKRAPEKHYPAPHALIELWQRHGGDPRAMYPAEARSIARLLLTPTSQNLVRLFKLQERAKGFARDVDSKVKHVHVIGGGTMGGDIAAWCALRGMTVTLQDREPRFMAPAMKRAARLFDRRVRRRHERLAVADRLIPDFTGAGARGADLVIEAIIEDADAKKALFAQLENEVGPDTLLATNTSSIPLDDIAAAMSAPERLVGVHFFNPVAQMRLVEIVSGSRTDDEVVARAARFVTDIDRLALPVKSAPGFLVNRVLSPYLQEAMVLLEEGVSADAIDAAACGFGMPMGPLELADTVGLDICLHVGEILAAAFGGEAPAILRRRVSQGRLGRKTGQGFYRWKGGKPERGAPGDGDVSRDVMERMLLRLCNEGVRVLREGIVEDADLVDLGMVFGTGFAPFRGGPLNYARDRSAGDCVARLEQLAGKHGDRFKPDDGWSAL